MNLQYSPVYKLFIKDDLSGSATKNCQLSLWDTFGLIPEIHEASRGLPGKLRIILVNNLGEKSS